VSGSGNERVTAIPFVKASACGNDFLLIEAKFAGSKLAEGKSPSGEISTLTRRLCDRNRGVGADGVEWLSPDAEADVAARLINADGSAAEISGNGTRCVAAEFAWGTGKKEVAVRTGAGVKHCRLIKQTGLAFEFEADMGAPVIGDELHIATKLSKTVGTPVSMGNPHYVIFVDEFREGWQQQAALIGAQPQFPEGVNVVYVRPRSKHEIEIRMFERGAGETQSSGTGSCSGAVASIASGKAESPVTVVAPGGSQTVRWEKNVYLQGPANIVCRGEFFITENSLS
jgi:diaminopimelate epimerase